MDSWRTTTCTIEKQQRWERNPTSMETHRCMDLNLPSVDERKKGRKERRREPHATRHVRRKEQHPCTTHPCARRMEQGKRETNDSLTRRMDVRHVDGIDVTRRHPSRRKSRHARASDARHTHDVHACAVDQDANPTHAIRTNPCRRCVQRCDACHDRNKTNNETHRTRTCLHQVQRTSKLTPVMRNWPQKVCPRCHIARLAKEDTNGWTYGTCCIGKGSSSWDKTSTRSSETKS